MRRRSASAAIFAAAMTLLLALATGAAAAPLGSVTEFNGFSNPGPAPAPTIVTGPDGNLWFVNRGTTKAISKVNPSTGGIEEFGIEENGGNFGPVPQYLVTGPDGNLWFTDGGATKAIGKINPSTGAIIEFGIEENGGLPSSSPLGIASGPDGNVWFADATNKAIGKINPSTGAIQEFLIASNGGNPSSSVLFITNGADGNLWFLDNGTTKGIGRITPSGTITMFTEGLNAGATFSAITLGSDGNVWFTDRGTTKGVGRITPSGTITMFTAGLNAGARPEAIAAGPGGNLWIADRGTTKAIARVTTSGTIREYSADLSSTLPVSITAGPEGEQNVWFVNGGATKSIGRFGTEPQPELTITKEGTGSGTVVSNPTGIECGTACSTDGFETGKKVTLTASPAADSKFLSWKGCEKGGAIGHTCTVTMDKAKTVIAKFGPTKSLTLKKAGTGTGTVKSSPSGISCDGSCSTNVAAFTEGATVVLTAVPTKYHAFAGWSGAGCEGTGTCEVTMSAAKEVTAEFTATKYALTLTKAGGGTGAVKSKPASLTCGATCSSVVSSFYEGTAVEVTATASKGSSLNWKTGSGTCTGSTSPCVVTMSEAKALVAEFK